MNYKLMVAGVLALAAVPVIAHPGHTGSQPAAQTQPMDHMQMGQGQMMMHNSAANPYAEAEMRMHERMMSAMGGNADETWALKMIEHHRGAVETGQILQSAGSDPALKAMARKSMAEQQKEIAQLHAWLRQHGHRGH